jgi:hypothetical protein
LVSKNKVGTFDPCLNPLVEIVSLATSHLQLSFVTIIVTNNNFSYKKLVANDMISTSDHISISWPRKPKGKHQCWANMCFITHQYMGYTSKF